MGLPAEMPELKEDLASTLVNRRSDLLPGIDVFLTEDGGCVLPSDGLFGDLGAFGDDETCRGTLGVVLDHEVVGDVGARIAAGAGHGAHDDAVRELEVIVDEELCLEAGRIVRHGCNRMVKNVW